MIKCTLRWPCRGQNVRQHPESTTGEECVADRWKEERGEGYLNPAGWLMLLRFSLFIHWPRHAHIFIYFFVMFTLQLCSHEESTQAHRSVARWSHAPTRATQTHFLILFRDEISNMNGLQDDEFEGKSPPRPKQRKSQEDESENPKYHMVEKRIWAAEETNDSCGWIQARKRDLQC